MTLQNSQAVLVTHGTKPFASVWLGMWGVSMSATWLLPSHNLPWTTFHQDAWAALMLLVAYFQQPRKRPCQARPAPVAHRAGRRTGQLARDKKFPIYIMHTKPAETELIMDEIQGFDMTTTVGQHFKHDIRWLRAGLKFEICRRRLAGSVQTDLAWKMTKMSLTKLQSTRMANPRG